MSSQLTCFTEFSLKRHIFCSWFNFEAVFLYGSLPNLVGVMIWWSHHIQIRYVSLISKKKSTFLEFFFQTKSSFSIWISTKLSRSQNVRSTVATLAVQCVSHEVKTTFLDQYWLIILQLLLLKRFFFYLLRTLFMFYSLSLRLATCISINVRSLIIAFGNMHFY